MVQAWTRGKRQTVHAYACLAQRQTVRTYAYVSPSLDCTVAMTSRRNIPLPVTGITLAAITVKHTQSYSKTIKATYDLGEMDTSQSKNLPAHGTTNAIAKLVESHQH